MTKMQIKKALAAAGIVPIRLGGAGANWEVEIQGKDATKFQRKVCKAGGYTTGYGSVVLRAGYVGRGALLDTGRRNRDFLRQAQHSY